MAGVVENATPPVCFGVDWRTAKVADIKEIDINARDEDGRTPLHFAAEYSDKPQIISALINAGANVNAEDKRSNTPLHWATKFDPQNSLHWEENNHFDPDIVLALINAGANVNMQNKYGAAPLHRAVSHPYYNVEMISALIDAGADVNAKDGDGDTPLHWAMNSTNYFSTPSTLIKAGADVNAQNESDDTPLHLAIRNTQNYYVIETLLRAGADVNAQNKAEETPPLMAITILATTPPCDFVIIDLDTVSDLLSKSSRLPNFFDIWQDAASVGGWDHQTTTLQTLIKGLQNQRNHEELNNILRGIAEGDNPTYEGEMNNKEVIDSLIDDLINSGVNINASMFSETALHVAAKNDDPHMISVLLSHDYANKALNARDAFGETPLHIAINNENSEIIPELISDDTINARDENGNTPLHFAAIRCDNSELMEKLLEAGADPTVKNKGGKTAYDFAMENENLKGKPILEKLRELSSD